MKTKEEVQKECFGVVYDTDDFVRIVNSGCINDFDGIGVFHDGENETNIDVFSDMRYPDSKKYPYVCWYNK